MHIIFHGINSSAGPGLPQPPPRWQGAEVTMQWMVAVCNDLPGQCYQPRPVLGLTFWQGGAKGAAGTLQHPTQGDFILPNNQIYNNWPGAMRVPCDALRMNRDN